MLKDRVAARRRNFDIYQQALADLPGVEFMPELNFGTSTRWLSCLTFNPDVANIDREQIRLTLLEQQIESRPVWKPMHLQPAFVNCECVNNGVAEDLFKKGLCLPFGFNLTVENLARVISQIIKLYSQ